MRYVTILCLLLVISVQCAQASDEELSNRADIDFHTDGKLMWLIDITKEGDRGYTLESIEERESRNVDVRYSYETYMNLVNSDPKYKYKNWRMPTIDELLTLELEDNYFAKLFAKDKNQRCIDSEIFYDDHEQTYWTRSVLRKDVYITVNFGGYRFAKKSIMGSRDGHGSGASVHASFRDDRHGLRLVRDVD